MDNPTPPHATEANNAPTPKPADQAQVMDHLDQTIAWFDTESTRTGKWHFRLRSAQIVLASVIPASQAIPSSGWARGIAAVCGAGIAICQGWDSLHHYGDHYVSWRGTAQQLKRERFLFSVNGGPYSGLSGADALRLLTTHAVAAETAEGQQWQSKQLAENETAAASQSAQK